MKIIGYTWGMETFTLLNFLSALRALCAKSWCTKQTCVPPMCIAQIYPAQQAEDEEFWMPSNRLQVIAICLLLHLSPFFFFFLLIPHLAW